MTKRTITIESLAKKIDRQEEVIAQLIKIVASTNNQMSKLMKRHQNTEVVKPRIVN